MKPQNFIHDKEAFQKTATHFFNSLFAKALEGNHGEISIEVPNSQGAMNQTYHNNVTSAVSAAYELCQQGNNVYVGVNPRVGRRSKKENVHWLTAFHAEIDYGKDGHKKKPEYDTRDEAFEAITRFEFKPTIVNHSGGGFHCYSSPT